MLRSLVKRINVDIIFYSFNQTIVYHSCIHRDFTKCLVMEIWKNNGRVMEESWKNNGKTMEGNRRVMDKSCKSIVQHVYEPCSKNGVSYFVNIQ